MAEKFNPQRMPRVGSHLLIATKEGHPPVEATLEGYLPGRVAGQPLKGPRAHRNILIRVAGVPLKSTTAQIAQVTWKAPNRKPAKAKRPKPTGVAREPLPVRAGGLWEEVLGDDPIGLLSPMDPLEQWDAANEDADGQVPARLDDADKLFPRAYPGVRGMAKLSQAFYRKYRL